MPIQFRCPHCGLETNVADEYAGQSGPCSGCGKTVTVPPLAGGIPFAPPARPSRRSTPIVLIVGPEALSDGPTATPMREITDGTSNTIMVVEVSGSGIHWLEPRDLDLDEFGPQINGPAGAGIRSYHPGGVQVLFCDGSVRFLSETIDTSVLEAMITKAGGEVVGNY